MSESYGIDGVLLGLSCTSVTKEYSWHLTFGGGAASLDLECPWRLLADGSIAYGADDHEQKFGLPAPVDGVSKTEKILANSPVTNVDIRSDTGDLCLTFANGAKLEAFNHSAGYEAWTLSGKGALGFLAVAQGGGHVEVFLEGATHSTSGAGSRYIGSS